MTEESKAPLSVATTTASASASRKRKHDSDPSEDLDVLWLEAALAEGEMDEGVEGEDDVKMPTGDGWSAFSGGGPAATAAVGVDDFVDLADDASDSGTASAAKKRKITLTIPRGMFESHAAADVRNRIWADFDHAASAREAASSGSGSGSGSSASTAMPPQRGTNASASMPLLSDVELALSWARSHRPAEVCPTCEPDVFRDSATGTFTHQWSPVKYDTKEQVFYCLGCMKKLYRSLYIAPPSHEKRLRAIRMAAVCMFCNGELVPSPDSETVLRCSNWAAGCGKVQVYAQAGDPCPRIGCMGRLTATDAGLMCEAHGIVVPRRDDHLAMNVESAEISKADFDDDGRLVVNVNIDPSSGSLGTVIGSVVGTNSEVRSGGAGRLRKTQKSSLDRTLDAVMANPLRQLDEYAEQLLVPKTHPVYRQAASFMRSYISYLKSSQVDEKTVPAPAMIRFLKFDATPAELAAARSSAASSAQRSRGSVRRVNTFAAAALIMAGVASGSTPGSVNVKVYTVNGMAKMLGLDPNHLRIRERQMRKALAWADVGTTRWGRLEAQARHRYSAVRTWEIATRNRSPVSAAAAAARPLTETQKQSDLDALRRHETEQAILADLLTWFTVACDYLGEFPAGARIGSLPNERLSAAFVEKLHKRLQLFGREGSLSSASSRAAAIKAAVLRKMKPLLSFHERQMGDAKKAKAVLAIEAPSADSDGDVKMKTEAVEGGTGVKLEKTGQFVDQADNEQAIDSMAMTFGDLHRSITKRHNETLASVLIAFVFTMRPKDQRLTLANIEQALNVNYQSLTKACALCVKLALISVLRQ